MADALDELLAKQAITEVLHRYCHALDRNDRALAGTVWHEGGSADYEGIFQGTGEDFLDWVFDVHTGFERTSHQVTNVLVTVDAGGERATSETYVTVCLRSSAADIVDRGRYLDSWSRRDGTWAIDARRFVGDIQQILPRGEQQ